MAGQKPVTSAEQMLPELLSAVRSAVKHQKALLGSPWASPPEVSTAMERPTPILVGSVDAGWLADMFAGRRQGECALMEGQGPECCCCRCCSSALCPSGEGMMKAPGFIDPFLILPLAPSHYPLTHTTIYTPGPGIHLWRTVTVCT